MSYLLRQVPKPGRRTRYYRHYSSTLGVVTAYRGRAAHFTLAGAKAVKAQLDRLGRDYVIVDADTKRFKGRRLVREAPATPP